ncbi:MAG: class I SAM-dependent methyltransferase [Bacteroidetes bacterium]|nr:class I SAM-dependent methyltransferase [Bacteroidota bacterium]
MQERHSNRKQYFKEQSITTEKYVIPYIEERLTINESTRVLEIGCGIGGNLLPFIKKGCQVTGVDIIDKQIKRAKQYIEEIVPNSNTKLISNDIYNVTVEDIGTFDLIVMRDVIEHIHNQERFFAYVKTFLKPEGQIFLGYPPWCMPFGGHHQICKSKLLSHLPFFHLLNKSLYKWVMKAFKEKKVTIDSLLEIKETGISINRFEKIIKHENYVFTKKDFYFFNPNYEIKFGLKPRKQNKIIASIPYIRDFFSTGCYCLIKKKLN